LITLGEGWHNNHHYYAGSTRQGFFWWQIDITYYLLKIMSWMGLVWGIKDVPERVYAARQHVSSREFKQLNIEKIESEEVR
jgi:stearoyl-CoA desaturase (delta-9 desaturase)